MIYENNQFIGDKYLVVINKSNIAESNKIISYMSKNFKEVVDFTTKLQQVDYEPILVFTYNNKSEKYYYSDLFNCWVYTPCIRDSQ